MRAIFYDNLKNLDETCLLKDDNFHHLAKVLRVKLSDEVLFLDGSGHSRLAQIQSVDKKSILCRFQEKLLFTEPAQNNFSIALGKTKREALELSLKQLVELNIQKIYLFSSEYSQKIDLKDERLKKVLISSLEQSNAKYLPVIEEIELKDIKNLNYENIFYFSSTQHKDDLKEIEKSTNLIVIGPEGGLSSFEESFLGEMENCRTIKLETNIMRAPTAVSYCLGFCQGKVKNMV